MGVWKCKVCIIVVIATMKNNVVWHGHLCVYCKERGMDDGFTLLKLNNKRNKNQKLIDLPLGIISTLSTVLKNYLVID